VKLQQAFTYIRTNDQGSPGFLPNPAEQVYARPSFSSQIESREAWRDFITMLDVVQSVRDTLQYAYGYSQGRLTGIGVSTIIAKATNLVSIPLPLLSLFAVPFFGGSTTRMSLVAFLVGIATQVSTIDVSRIDCSANVPLQPRSSQIGALRNVGHSTDLLRATGSPVLGLRLWVSAIE
jgi:hypothetical protein